MRSRICAWFFMHSCCYDSASSIRRSIVYSSCTISSDFVCNRLSYTEFYTTCARYANLRVLSVWKKLILAGDIVQMIAVRELPPIEFYSIRVIFESLYGMWDDFPSANLLMTCERTKRDLLM